MIDLNRNEAKKIFFLKKKIKMAISKILSFSSTTKSWAIFVKISRIGPWVSRINWWILLNLYGHQAVRHKLCFLQKTLKFIFSSKLSLHRTAWRPCKLSKVDDLRINSSYSPEDQFVKYGITGYGVSRPGIQN